MTLNFSFFKQKNDFTPNFNYIDILDATGYIIYDGVYDTINSKYILFPSSNIFTGSSSTGNSFASAGIIDIDFDLSAYQLPRRIKGNVLVGFTIKNTAAGSSNITTTIKIRKWDGTTETDLYSGTTGVIAQGGANEICYALQCPVALTKFNAGDILRVSFTLDHANASIPHCPRDVALGGTFTAGSTRLRVVVPYKLDFL